MIRIIFVLFATLLSTIIFSQNPRVKKAKNQQLAIDILYNKYKDKDSTTIYFPGGSLKGKIEISYNDNSKPSSITIQGNTWSVDYIAKFVSSFVKQKLAKGFKEEKDDFGGSGTSQNYIEQELNHGKNEIKITLIKGNEYSTIHCYKSAIKYAPRGSYEELENKWNTKYNFFISTSDLRREAGAGGQNFNF